MPGNPEPPSLQTSPPSGLRRSFKSRESAHHLSRPLAAEYLLCLSRERSNLASRTHSISRDLQTNSSLFSRDSNSVKTAPFLWFPNQLRPFSHTSIKLLLQLRLTPGRLCAARLRPRRLPPGVGPESWRGVRAPSLCCARPRSVARAVSPWARAGPRAHGTRSRGPLSGDGGDGECRGRRDRREAPYLP